MTDFLTFAMTENQLLVVLLLVNTLANGFMWVRNQNLVKGIHRKSSPQDIPREVLEDIWKDLCRLNHSLRISQVLTTLSLIWLALFLGFNNDMSLEEVALFLCVGGSTMFFIAQQYQCKFYVDFMDAVLKLWMQSK